MHCRHTTETQLEYRKVVYKSRGLYDLLGEILQASTVLAIYMVAVRPWSVTLAHVYRTQGVTCKVAQEPLHRFLYCRSPFFLPRGTRAFTVFSLCSANFNEKIAAPRRTRVTNATKICRTSLVARYAAPPCVTRYAATYIASTVYETLTGFYTIQVFLCMSTLKPGLCADSASRKIRLVFETGF